MNRLDFTLAGASLCSYGFDRAIYSPKIGGPDVLSLTLQTEGAAPFARNQIIALAAQVRNEAGELVSTTNLFSGRVVAIKALGDPAKGWEIRVESGWHDLALCPLEQQRSTWNAASSQVATVTVPQVTLGLSNSGVAETTGQTISRIVGLAASRGANITAGSIFSGMTVPPTQVENINCDQGIRQYLRHHPDAKAWVEAGQFRVSLASSLPTVTLSECADGLVIQSDLRQEIAPVGVQIYWKISQEFDGEQRVVWEVDTAGNTSGWPPPLTVVIPLRGAEVSYQKADIRTRTLPTDATLDSDSSKNFFKGLFPELSAASNTDLELSDFSLEFVDPKEDGINGSGDATANPNSRPITLPNTVADFPRQLVSGQVAKWMEPLEQHEAILKVKISYSGDNETLSDKLSDGLEIAQPITITNALSRVYREAENVDFGEAPIPGLAAQYWNAIKTPQYEGSITGVLDPKTLTIRPGFRVLEPAKIPTAAVVESCEMDLIRRTLKATFGPTQYRSPQDIVAMRAALNSNRPKWTSPEEFTDAKTGAGNLPIPAGSTPTPRTLSLPSSARKPRPWDLVEVPQQSGDPQWKIQAGKILDGTGKAGSYLTHSNPTETFDLAAGGHVVIEFSDREPTSFEVNYYDEWPITDDYLVEIDEDSLFVRALIPLYEIKNSAIYGAQKVGDLWAEPVSTRLVHSFFQQDGQARILAPDVTR